MNTWNSKWCKIVNQEAHQITGSFNNVCPYPINKLPSQLQNMCGISEAYISGSFSGSETPEGITIGGELLVTRIDNGLGKGYVYFFGISGSNVYFSGPYKPYDGHYFNTGSSVPVNKLFGKTTIPE